MTAMTQFDSSKSEPLARLENAYAEKRDDYFACERREMLDLFPAQSRRVLDVGCGSGVFGQTLKKKFGTGFEILRKSGDAP